MDKKIFEELSDVWENIYDSGKPVLLYGMGNGGEKMLRGMKQHKIKCDGIFASDEFVRGQNFAGFEVMKYSEAVKRYGSFCIVLGFGSQLADVMKTIERNETEQELYAPDASVCDDTFFDKKCFLDNFDEAQKAYSLLSDDVSQRTFENLCMYKISGRLSYLRQAFSPVETKLTEVTENEIYVDLGAYTGDTVCDFVKRTNDKYSRIYAVEPDKHNFQKCVKSTLDCHDISYYNSAAWSLGTQLCFSGGAGRQASVCGKSSGEIADAISVDEMLGGKQCTYIKYDVEGADVEALQGSSATIKKYQPKICTALYHRPYDYIKLPLLINSICEGYNFYMRQSPYYPAWETNLFCNT